MNSKTIGLILLALLLILPILACAADSGSSGGSSGATSRVSGGDLLKLLPKDVSRIQVVAADEITGGSVPESMTDLFEGTWQDYTLGGEDEIVTVDDVDQVVWALSPEGGVVMLSGSRIDFAAIGQWLADEDTNIGKTSYQGEEMWGNDSVAMVPMQSDGYLVFGDTDAVKELLKVKARGTGSLAEDPENELKKAYEDAAAGWYVSASSECDEFSADLRSCEAYSITGSKGQEDYLVNVTYRLTFRSEERAESQALDVEDLLDDRIDGRDWKLDIDEVETDGVSVKARMSGDEEDFTPQWLGISSIFTPPPLPTAMPEPESRNTNQSGTAPTATLSPSVSATVIPTAAPAATRAPTAVPPTLAPTATSATEVDILSPCSSFIRGILRDGTLLQGSWGYECPTGGTGFEYSYGFDIDSRSWVDIEILGFQPGADIGLELFDVYTEYMLAVDSGLEYGRIGVYLDPGRYVITVTIYEEVLDVPYFELYFDRS